MWERFRRFGLDYCDLPTTLSNMADLMRIVALDMDGREGGIPIPFVILSVIGGLAYFYVYVFSMVWLVFWRETEDPVVDIVIFSLGIASSMSVVKLIWLHLKSKLLRKTVVAYLSCDKRLNSNSRMYRSLLKYMRVVKRRATFVWVMLMTNVIAYCLRPAVLPGRHLIEDGQALYGLEPMLETPNYEITLTVVGIAVVLEVFAASNVSCLLIIIAGYIEAQMSALSDELLHLWDDAQALALESTQLGNENKLKNQYIKQQLEYIIQAHAANLSLLRLAESVFSNSIAIEFGLLAICLIAELLGGLENTYLEIPYALTHVSMDCFAGQRLLEASLRFREALYACKWENFDVSNMRTVLVTMQNSNSMVMSAGGVAELRYTSLMSVLKSIFSAYTALRSTINK